jgi:hypothetical protein
MNVATQIATQLAVQAAAADERILRSLREAGASSDRSAVELSVDSSFDQSRLDCLVRTGAVVQRSDGRYYADERVIAAGEQRTRRLLGRLSILLVAALLVAVLASLLAR